MPASSFDPYYEWLGIEPHEQPADYYRLLGLPRFEADAGRIFAAADQVMGHVRTFQMGPRGAHTQKLLNELATARSCLLNPEHKAAYDAKLAAWLEQLQEKGREANLPPLGVFDDSLLDPPLAAAAWTQPSAKRDSTRPSLRRLTIALAVVSVVAIGGAVTVLIHQKSPRNGTPANSPPPPQAAAKASPRQPTRKASTERIVEPAAASGELLFLPGAAALAGELTLATSDGAQVLRNWLSPSDQAAWNFRVLQPGFFNVELIYFLADGERELELEWRIDHKPRLITLVPSGSAAFATTSFTIAIAQSGQHELSIRLPDRSGDDSLALKEVRLIPLNAARAP